jgi:hypothetical protein
MDQNTLFGKLVKKKHSVSLLLKEWLMTGLMISFVKRFFGCLMVTSSIFAAHSWAATECSTLTAAQLCNGNNSTTCTKQCTITTPTLRTTVAPYNIYTINCPARYILASQLYTQEQAQGMVVNVGTTQQLYNYTIQGYNCTTAATTTAFPTTGTYAVGNKVSINTTNVGTVLMDISAPSSSSTVCNSWSDVCMAYGWVAGAPTGYYAESCCPGGTQCYQNASCRFCQACAGAGNWWACGVNGNTSGWGFHTCIQYATPSEPRANPPSMQTQYSWTYQCTWSQSQCTGGYSTTYATTGYRYQCSYPQVPYVGSGTTGSQQGVCIYSGAEWTAPAAPVTPTCSQGAAGSSTAVCPPTTNPMQLLPPDITPSFD